MKITIVALHLTTGGAENSIITLSNMLCDFNDVEIITVYKLKENPDFIVNEKVKIRYLTEGIHPNKQEFFYAIKHFRIINVFKEGLKSIKVLFLRRFLTVKAIKQTNSDIIISTRLLFNKWISRYAKKSIIKIAQEHNHHNNDNKYIKKVIKSLKNINYFMPVSSELTNFYSEKLKKCNIKCIYIPHCLERFSDKTSDLESKNILSIGRLVSVKGFSDLIDIFNKIHKIYPDWKLNIIGDGILYNTLQKKIDNLGLSSVIALRGSNNKDQLEEIFLSSSIYVMTSYSESFGIVLIEAENYGLPILAFDSAQGAKEIIDNYVNGFLITNRNSLKMQSQISKLIEDKELRKYLGKNGHIYSQRYKKENILLKWKEFLKECQQKKYQ